MLLTFFSSSRCTAEFLFVSHANVVFGLGGNAPQVKFNALRMLIEGVASSVIDNGSVV